ncbi:MAG TPA: Hsp20/alpha crystallin family protein [Tepidisphaeraceae bacterium]|jgi:HSP20 family protein|nr:Hsp20/alpha crystallin family protein [Tepidisphaeraceae bacterium]
MPIDTAADPSPSNIARQANKLMEQMQRSYFNYCPSETWTPSVNLYENTGAYLVCVDLAGVEKEKIEVEVIDQILKLRGTRAVPMCDEAVAHGAAAAQGAEAHAPEAHGAEAHAAEPHGVEGHGSAAGPEHRRIRVHLMEIDHGSFCREVELPEDVDRKRIAANYRNGMLWIELPKK